MHLPVGHPQQLVQILPRPGGDRDHRHPQLVGQLGKVDLIPVPGHLVHEVQRHHHGPLQLQQLGGQVQVPLDVGGVHNVDDGVRPLAHDEVPGHDLLHGIGGQGVDAGQVHDGHRVAVHRGPTLLFLHRHPRPVAHVLVGAGQGVEQGGLAAVGVAHQGDLHFPAVVGGVVRRPSVGRRLVGVVGLHPLQGVRVGHVLLPGGVAPLSRQLAGGAGNHRDLLRVLLPQGQLIAPQVHLHGIPQRSHLPDRHLRPRGQSHIHQPALHRPLLMPPPDDHAPLPGPEAAQ